MHKQIMRPTKKPGKPTMHGFQRTMLWALASVGFTVWANLTWASADDTHKARFQNQITAITAADYSKFTQHGTATFNTMLSKAQFDAIAQSIGPRLNKGYDAVFLGSLKQQGMDVYLWKLDFADGGDDHLIKLVLDKGKIAGYWIQ